CFLVEHEGTDRQSSDNTPGICSKCSPPVVLDTTNGQRILEHMAGHILFDPLLISAVYQPCGACLRVEGLCSLHFKPRRGTSAARQIDWSRSTCANPVNFSMAYASVSKDADSPCSNVPVQCSLCTDTDPLVWTYNLETHCRNKHHRTAGPFLYVASGAKKPHVEYEISAKERQWMQIKWNNRFSKSKSTSKGTKEKTKPIFMISEAHKSSMALRCVLSLFLSH
ncbi:hypothetical protein DFH06DRAFT_986266, partial [Mycena polygramma]